MTPLSGRQRRRLSVPIASLSLSLAVTLATAVLVAPPTSAEPERRAAAPGAPGALSHFGLARKDCLGTAANTGSKVWYTVADGVLSDVYSPVVDTTNVETLQYVVTDGESFTDLQTRDMTYTVRSTDRSGMACQVTSSDKDGDYRLVTDYVTDPARDAVVMRTRLVTDEPGLAVYVRYDATMNGNGGGGADNGGGDDAAVDRATGALVSSDVDTETNAVNRDYAVPMFGALQASQPFTAASSGYAGTASDGLEQLDADHTLATSYARATDGNVVQTARLALDDDDTATLALGYGRTQRQSVRVAGASAAAAFDDTYAAYVATWRAYDRGLKRPAADLPATTRSAYWLSANVLKASEDKTFPGAIAASLSSPWGQAVSAGALPDGKPVYFGSYREVFARDLYEAFTGLLATGDVKTARSAVRFLFERQQLPDGRMPRNSLPNGRTAPDSGGDQLDETAFPILMAWQAGLGGDRALWRDHIKRAADFVVAHGPSFGSERWEEQGGYSPSTIAAQIAGLTAAASIAHNNGDQNAVRVYRATADEFARSIKDWTVTTSGPYADRYFIRLSRNGDPDSAVTYNLGNGSIDADQREVVDAGFLELTRLGILPADDPDVAASLEVVDDVIARTTPSGVGYYRYGTDAEGTEDGYGDCWEPDPTNCPLSGQPWPTSSSGSGQLWPVLDGERAEQALQRGDTETVTDLLDSMRASASGIGLVPEQEWAEEALERSPSGTDPETASIGFEPGEAAGSASPLTWAQAQLVRLIASHGAKRPVEQPGIVRTRYAAGGQAGRAEVPLQITSPEAGATVDADTTTVTGTTMPGALVDVSATAATSGDATTVGATADRTGAFSVEVPTPFGTSVLTAAATSPGRRTGFAQRTVVSDSIEGTTVLDVDDPDSDDDGPGTFTYPTAGDFTPGAYDLQRFRVIDAGDTIFLRATLRDLSPTFGSALGAQLLDVFVHDPDAEQTSTAAPYASRNYSIAPRDAWSRRIEVQGFADPVFVDASGASLGGAQVIADRTSRTITIGVPAVALGRPGSDWSFAVVLHGQDGFSADQARGFQQVAQDYQFGLCPAGGTEPVCSIDPGTAPKAMDVVTPDGVDQAVELDPTRGPVVVRGVAVP